MYTVDIGNIACSRLNIAAPKVVDFLLIRKSTTFGAAIFNLLHVIITSRH